MSTTKHNIRLRALEPSDLELLYLWENDPEVWRVSGTLSPISRERLARFIEEQNYDLYATRQMRLIIEAEGAIVGSIDIFDFDPQHLRFGIGILIYQESDRRKGYAKEAIETVVEYGRNTLNLKQIWANIAADNIASIALFESCGFSKCAHRKEWINRGGEFIDEVEYQLIF
ncbi:MAG: GNAT family N-acetyltransferase [Alistipes sp.]|nr:GNAT family N-acetyltransferase [Alistipes sp.]